jgi:hypothetical protein
MPVIYEDKTYSSFDELVAQREEKEKRWPWYKKLYYAFRRSAYWPAKIWYWFRCHTFTRYHALDMRNRFYYWGWQDRCDLLLYASFNLLCQFIEEEHPPKEIDGEENAHWNKAYNEMYVLYNWWKTERKEYHNNMRKEGEDKDQEMLHRLVEIRQFLWM